MALDGAGNLSTTGTIVSTGNITAGSGRLRATYGHSGDSNAAPILGDFGYSGSFGAFIIQWPRFLMCGVSVVCSIGNIAGSGQVGISAYFNFNWPTTFPNVCVSAWGVGNDAGGFEEGSEMCIGFLTFNQTGGTFRVNRVSGVNTGGESCNVQIIGIGW